MEKITKKFKNRLKTLFILLFTIIFPLLLNLPLHYFFSNRTKDKFDIDNPQYPLLSSNSPIDANYFSFYKNITIDYNKVSGSGTYTDFPVLISILDSDLRFDVQPDGDDIAFSIDNNWLDHEIELFNQTYSPTQAKLVVWVRVPTLSGAIDTVIRMSYSNSTMASRQNPTGVWNSNYVAVWHMNQDPSSTNILDSSSNNNDLSTTGFTSDQRIYNQKLGTAIAFDGVNDFLGISPFSGPTNGFTFEFWFKFDNEYNVNSNTMHPYSGYNAYWNNDNPRLRFRGTGYDGHVATALDSDDGVLGTKLVWAADTWFHSTFRFSVPIETTTLYVDGIQDGIKVGNDLSVPHVAWNRLTIGSDNGADIWGPGAISEFRILNIPLSPGWINTEIQNQNYPDSFYTVGEEKIVSENPPNYQYFNYYKIVTIDYAKVNGTGSHVNFPFLLSLVDDDLRYDVQDDGEDIAFSMDGKWLDHQIELFNQTYSSTQAQIIAWIRIPFLSTAKNTTINMYYGNSSMGSQQNPTGVWDSSYVGVWHLNENPSGTPPQMKDSTLPSSDGSTSGGMTSSQQVPGVIDGSLNFDGNNDYVSVINNPELQITGEFTVQAWFKADDTIDNDYLVAKYGGSGFRGWDISFDNDSGIAPDGRIMFRYSPDGISIETIGYERVRINQWYYVVGIFKPNEFAKFFINGTEFAIDTSAIPPSMNDPPLPLRIARRSDSSAAWFDGIIDEVRISNLARSNEWIATEYNNQFNPNIFYTVGKENYTRPVVYVEAQINAIDLYGNLIPNVSISMYQGIQLIKQNITNINGSVRFTEIIEGAYNFTATLSSNIGNFTELVNRTSQAIIIDKGFQVINLICNVSTNFFEVIDIDGDPLESGWIVIGNNSNLLQNSTIDNLGRATFYWLNTTPYQYNYTVYYQNQNYQPEIIKLATGDLLTLNATIQVQTNLTTVEFTILTIDPPIRPVSGVKIVLRVNNTNGASIVNLTTDREGKTTLRWLNSSGIDGNYSLQIEFFNDYFQFNITAGGLATNTEMNFTVKNKISMEFRILIDLDNFQTELVSLNPTDFISVKWGIELKLRTLFNITKAGGLPLLGPTYADSMTYQVLLGSTPIQLGSFLQEEGNDGIHYTYIDSKQLGSDVNYIITISAQKSGFAIPSDLILQLNVLENEIQLNQSENDDSTLSTYWLDNINMTLNSYGKISERITIENAIFQSIDHEFNFLIPDIENDWNLSTIIFNFYNITWNAPLSNINITIEDPYGNFYKFNRTTHGGWDYNQGTWTGISLDLDRASPTYNNRFEFIIGGTFINKIDIIADAYFIRDLIEVQYSKFNVSDTISILTGIEGWAIKNITFEIFNSYNTSTWSAMDLSDLESLNITTNDGFCYSLDSGDGNGNGNLTIDDRIINPIFNQFLFSVETEPGVIFDANIKVDYIQEFYKNQFLETINFTKADYDINNGGIFQINAGYIDWSDTGAILRINGIRDQLDYYLPSELAMSITIGGQMYSVSDDSIGTGMFSLTSFTKDQLLYAFIETTIPVNFSLSVNIVYSREAFYETIGSLDYIIREAPSIYGTVQYEPDLGYYLQTIDTSLIDTDVYTVRFTAQKDHFETAIKDLELRVQNRLTLINGEAEFYRSIENVYVKDGVNFTLTYTDALTGAKISDLKTQFFIWEKYSSNGSVLENDQKAIITSKVKSYILDFDTETRSVGEYLLIATLDKENYDYKNAMILLSINKREIGFTLGDQIKNKQVSVVQGKTIPIVIYLTDPTKEDLPLINATIFLTIGGVKYKIEDLGNGTYRFDFQTNNINAFFTATTLRGLINISRENYISIEFSIIIVIGMQEIFPGFPTFYFLLIVSAVIAVTASIVGYRVYKYAKIPTFVKKVRAMKKAIEGDKSISESLLYRTKNAFIGERVRDKWEDVGLSVENVLGIKPIKEKKVSKIERRISETVERRKIKPIGLVFMKWNERIGTEILAKFPEETTVSEKTLMQIYSTHEYTGDKGVITLTSGLLNIISYYTGPERGYYLVLLLNIDDDPDMYEGGMTDILRAILDNIDDDSYIQMLPSLFQRLSVYPSLSDEEILSFNYHDEIKRMIIENLRDAGAITKAELMIWLRDEYVEGFIDIEATLLELLKRDIVKQVSVKGIPSELIFLTNDFFMLRIPPVKIFKDPASRGLPTQFIKEYRTEITKFFQNYHPTSEDTLNIIEILINPQAYETIRLLRTSIVTLQDLEKLKKKGVENAYSILKLLWDNQMVKVFRDENDTEYYALLSDFYMDLIFPKYLLTVIKTAYEQKSQANKVLIEYLKVLEVSYFDLKSRDKT